MEDFWKTWKTFGRLLEDLEDFLEDVEDARISLGKMTIFFRMSSTFWKTWKTFGRLLEDLEDFWKTFWKISATKDRTVEGESVLVVVVVGRYHLYLYGL